MISVIIEDDYDFFRYGVEAILLHIANKYDRKLTISYEIDPCRACHADIIIKSILGSEINMCHVIPHQRHRRSIVILIVDSADSVKYSRRAICLSQAVIIDRSLAPAKLENIFNKCWSDIERSKSSISNHCLDGCSPFSLNGLQLKISKLMHDNLSVKEIAVLLNINLKTVYAHKYKLMNSLNIEKNHNFFKFIQYYYNKHSLLKSSVQNTLK